MKKNDIAVLILIASISFLAAWIIANSFIGEPKGNQNVKSAEIISSEVDPIDKKVFSRDAINPTVERSIGKSANSLPFNQE